MESLWEHTYDNRRVFDYNNVFKTGGIERKDNPLSFSELNPQQFGEIQQVFLNEIKSNPQDWKVEQEEENGLWVVKHKSGRRHYKNISPKAEGDEWWKKVEEILTIKSTKEEINQNPKPVPNNKDSFQIGILIVVGISLAGGLILIAFFIVKRKKRILWSN